MVDIKEEPATPETPRRPDDVTMGTLATKHALGIVTNGNATNVAPYPGTKLDSVKFAKQPALPGALKNIIDDEKERYAPYERAVELHLRSQGGNADRFYAAGAISETMRDLVKVFAKIHDYGYRLDVPDDEFNFIEQRERYVSEFARIGTDLLHMQEGAAREKAEKLYEFLLKNKQNRMIYRVMGHAAKSLPYMIDVIRKNLLQQPNAPDAAQAEKLARGLAYLFFVHHAGRPISTVMDEWCKGMVPEEFREMLGVDIGTLATEEESGLPKEEAMRLRAIRFAVDECGYDEQEAKDTVAVVYASDRLSAGNAQEFYAKKGRLVVGNILGNKDDTTWTYDNYVGQVEKQLTDEPAAAIQASRAIGANAAITEFVDYQMSDPEGVPKTRAKVLKNALVFANGRLKELGGIFGVDYAFAGHFSKLDDDLACVEAIWIAAQKDANSHYLTHDGREEDLGHLTDLHDMLVCIRAGLRPVKIDLEAYPQGSPERKLAEAVSTCPPGRRRSMLNGMLTQATAALKEGRSILKVRDYSGESESVILAKNQRNDTVFAVLSEGVEVIDPETDKLLDRMDPPNVLGEISAVIEDGRATATCRARKGYPVTLLEMDRADFLPLLNEEEFADDYASLVQQRLIEQEA